LAEGVSIYIKAIEFQKDPDDPNQAGHISAANLPFSIIIKINRESSVFLSDNAVAFLEECSFAPAKRNGSLSALYDRVSGTFTFSGIAYTGSGRELSFSIMDGALYNTFSYDVSGVVGAAPVEITVDGNGDSSSGKSSASSKEPDPPLSLVPHLLAASYKYPPDIRENVPFEINITFINTSAKIAIENALIHFVPITNNTRANAFQLVGSSNIKYIEFLAPGEKIDVKINCVLEEKTSFAHTIDIEAAFQYYDIKDKDPLKASDSYSISVAAALSSSIRLEKIRLPEKIYAGKFFALEYRVVNTGRQSVRDIDLSVLSADGKILSRAYIGELAAGKDAKSEPEIELFFENTGEYNLTVRLDYLDEKSGKLTHITNPLKITVEYEESSSSGGESSLAESMDNSATNPAIIVNQPQEIKIDSAAVIAFASALVLALAAYIVYRIFKKPKAKKEELPELSLDDFYDDGDS
jgi:hypothetical protein